MTPLNEFIERYIPRIGEFLDEFASPLNPHEYIQTWPIHWIPSKQHTGPITRIQQVQMIEDDLKILMEQLNKLSASGKGMD